MQDALFDPEQTKFCHTNKSVSASLVAKDGFP